MKALLNLIRWRPGPPMLGVLILAAGCATPTATTILEPTAPTPERLACSTDEECEAAWGFSVEEAMTW